MLDFPRWKVWLTILTIVIGVLFALPSVLPPSVTQYLPARFAATKINLGLDLKGGSHLLLEADTGDVAKQRLERMDESIRLEMRRADPRIEIGDISSTAESTCVASRT
jgi:preprotein translocase subunit SecD